MRQEQPVFEVRCDRCSVTYPVGTRTCIHCGERLGRGGGAGAPRVTLRAAASRRAEAPFEVEEEELEVPGRSGVMSPVAILWVVLLVGGAVYRLCAGAGG